MEDPKEEQRPVSWRRWAGVAVCGVVLVGSGLWLKHFLDDDTPQRKPSLQQITLIKPPPPPPPPEKPPEPVVKEEIKLAEPEPEPMDQADEPPPGPDLGVDAEGTGSGDGFGLVGRKGGADLIGGSRGNPWAWYDAIVNDAVNSAFQDALAREHALKDKTYRVVVKVWIDADGKVSRIAAVDKTGDPKVDELIQDVLKNLRTLRENPPADMPQPLKIRVTSRA
ncbi:TonB C-terminal domain-containing protein [Nitrosospira sp. Nsp13]|uniref:TonB C-terminal domain-containing protein n=1 Tax=Nitrosospira sp. Nsp13 TaxID=1855332 RepID=UPI0008902CB0|nr:TonB C-terminal domain-containing protein [Nitrosospira sp. Nsp13]SCY11789.1 outer membrane transport energization protein TonB [Nitrosospira sp. Nsp13]